MKRTLIIRGGKAIGDLLWTTPVARLLAMQGDLVDVAVWSKNQAVYEGNPWIYQMVVYPDDPNKFAAWEEMTLKYDRIVDLSFTCEKKFLHRTDGFFGSVPSLDERRAIAAGHNFISETIQAAGLPAGDYLPELYPTKKETEILARHQDAIAKSGKKVVFWNLNGSTKEKFMVRGGQYIKTVLAAVPDSIHWILSGSPFTATNLPDDPRVRMANFDLRMAMLLTKIVHLVIGPESALINAAGAWNTPKMVCYSLAIPENLGAHFKNHYAIQPQCDCHPCYLIPLNWDEVWEPGARAMARHQDQLCRVKLPGDPYKSVGYHCNWNLPDQKVIDTAVKILTQ